MKKKPYLSHRIEQLEYQKTKMQEYLLIKFYNDDWHGVADAAMDLRDIEAEMLCLKNILDD